MKRLLDENLSRRLAGKLAELYPGTLHAQQAGLQHADDAGVWAYARENGLVIVSKDGDFHQLSLVHGFPPKVVYLRAGNCTTAAILRLLRDNAAELLAFEQNPLESLLILSK